MMTGKLSPMREIAHAKNTANRCKALNIWKDDKYQIIRYGEFVMTALRKPDRRPVRKPRPTGERFDAPAAHEQAKQLYPEVMARLAE